MCSSLLFRSRNLAVFYLVCVSVTNCFVRVKIFARFPLWGRPLLCVWVVFVEIYKLGWVGQ